MKRILVGLALAAAVLNGTLASAGSASLSASELQVDGVEMMAEGETKIIDPITGAIIGGLIVSGVTAGCHYLATCGGEWVTSYKWINKYSKDGGEKVPYRKDCVECSIFSDQGCTPPEHVLL